MKTLRKTAGICLILALIVSVMAPVLAYADDNGSQGQTKSGQQGPVLAPTSDQSVEDILIMIFIMFFFPWLLFGF